MQKEFLFRICALPTCYVFISVPTCLVLFLFYLPKCVCIWLEVQGPLRECPKSIRLNEKLVPVLDVCLSCMLPVYGRVFCSLPILCVYLRMRMSSNQRSVAGVPFDSVGILQPTLLLHTTCMRSCQAAIGELAVWQHYKSKTKKK